jgi:hypothetical protein
VRCVIGPLRPARRRCRERSSRSASPHEFIGDRSAGGRYLSNFQVPRDPSIPYGDFRPGSDWWYPAIGANRMTGQIASYEQSVASQMLGTSMKAVELRKTSGASPTWHVVHGTYGGYVYAVEPGITVTSDTRDSNLSFVSPDLGWQVIGLDAGDLDNDGENELAVGTMLGTGDFVDWDTGVATKNRGHLYVLKPQPSAGGSNGSFTVTDLNGDAQLGGPGAGIGAGVIGVKIDDVNNDGQKEIWCGDGIGHLYLFRRDPGSGVWTCIYRSGDLGCFPGAYNNIHPIKETSTSSANYGKTVRLLVSSPGYVMLFQVDPNALLP